VLAVTPLICFCAQRVFYRKREGEWNMLRALGATQKQIFKTALLSGVVTAGITLVLSFLLSLISTRLLFSLFNRYLPAGGFIESVVLTYRIPWGAMALLPLLAVLCGLIPPLMAGLSYQKRGKNRTVSLMAGR
jgi:ABC-type lipoprotein release transport system permease subunit